MIYVRNEATRYCSDIENLDFDNEVITSVVRELARRLRWFASDPKGAEQQSKIQRNCSAYLTERCVSRILHDGKVVCDASNNPPSVLNNDQIVVTIFLRLKEYDDCYAISLANKPLEP